MVLSVFVNYTTIK